MANIKITDLAAITSAVGTDVIEIVSDPGGSPASKKITVDNLIGKSGAMAVQTNPKAMAQGIHMTYASSGSRGIAVADDDDIDFGTGNYTLVWRGVVPDYTPSADVILMQKTDGTNGWLLQVDTTGVLQLIRNADAAISSTSATSLTDGTEHEIVCAVTTETASVAGSVVFYVDGKILGSSVAITAGAPTTVSNAVSLYVSGTSAVRSNLTNKSAYTYNRALTASEVLNLYRNGIAFADKWGSQTSLVTGDDSTFASDTGWWTKSTGVTIGSGKCTYTNVADGSAGLYRNTKLFEAGRYVWVTYTISNITEGGIRIALYGPTYGTTRTANGTYTDYILASSTSTGLLYFGTVGETSCDIDDVTFGYAGATLALESEGIQTDKWYDSSSNALNATYPTSGSSLMRKNRPFMEQGTFTLTLTCGTSGTITLSSSHNTGTYTRIGNLVFLTGYFNINSVSSPVGILTFGGLPFTVNNAWKSVGGGGLHVTGLNDSATDPQYQWELDPNAKTGTISKLIDGVKAVASGDFKAGSAFSINIFYVTSD
jgi:hypothetical protein